MNNIQNSQVIEIMSPVGSRETLMAAVSGGADSIYLGIGKLNMRSRSSANFTINDLPGIVKICRENHIRIYVTVNTVVYDGELEELEILIASLAKHGVDAVIASDISVIQICARYNVPVHASTQLNITNIEAVRFFSAFCDVMVLARELTLKQVSDINKAICQQNICGPSGDLVRTELFVHGALCMAVSGKCYLSLDNFNYSANRGSCLQVCRRGYVVYDKEGETELEIDNEYIMSPKDLCTIGFLDKIVSSGVTVLKIEGRARSSEYVKTVTKSYREAVLSIKEGTYSEEKVAQWMSSLSRVYNRGFWDGYYLGKKLGEWTDKPGSKATKVREFIGKVTNYFSRIGVFELTIETGEIAIGDTVLITGPTTGVVELQIKEIRIDLVTVSTAVKADVCSIPTDELLRRGDRVYKLADPEV